MAPSCLVSTVQAGCQGGMVWEMFFWHTLGSLISIEQRFRVPNNSGCSGGKEGVRPGTSVPNKLATVYISTLWGWNNKGKLCLHGSWCVLKKIKNRWLMQHLLYFYLFKSLCCQLTFLSDHWGSLVWPLREFGLTTEGVWSDHWRSLVWPLKEFGLTTEGVWSDHWRSLVWPLKEFGLTEGVPNMDAVDQGLLTDIGYFFILGWISHPSSYSMYQDWPSSPSVSSRLPGCLSERGKGYLTEWTEMIIAVVYVR
jgi:hypothetical protein